MSFKRSAELAETGMKEEHQVPSVKTETHSYNTRSKKQVPVEWPLPTITAKKSIIDSGNKALPKFKKRAQFIKRFPTNIGLGQKVFVKTSNGNLNANKNLIKNFIHFY